MRLEEDGEKREAIAGSLNASPRKLRKTEVPLPIVFSDFQGLETFASEFSADIKTQAGNTEQIKITPELYSRLGGPYNRRNVYGAAISYGPKLPEKLWKQVLQFGLCSQGPLAQGFGYQEPLRAAAIHIRTRTAGRDDAWRLEIICPHD